MAVQQAPTVDIPAGLVEAIQSFPVRRAVEHCGTRIEVSPFAFYAACPQCGRRVKVRAYAGVPEVEDLFDAFFFWLRSPEAQELARLRQQALDEEAEGG